MHSEKAKACGVARRESATCAFLIILHLACFPCELQRGAIGTVERAHQDRPEAGQLRGLRQAHGAAPGCIRRARARKGSLWYPPPPPPARLPLLFGAASALRARILPSTSALLRRPPRRAEGKLDVVQFLLAAGANVNAKDRWNGTA